MEHSPSFCIVEYQSKKCATFEKHDEWRRNGVSLVWTPVADQLKTKRKKPLLFNFGLPNPILNKNSLLF
ncbi:hypothetical protein AC623_16230 [Bacillus sp. FJAT-27231]|nr:hypothetical protein AC623_16230 [Bacillus sp. FJAT-27231]